MLDLVGELERARAENTTLRRNLFKIRMTVAELSGFLEGIVNADHNLSWGHDPSAQSGPFDECPSAACAQARAIIGQADALDAEIFPSTSPAPETAVTHDT